MKTGKFLSNYVKAKDIKNPTPLTITSAESQTFNEGKPDEATKLVVYFKEIEQGVVLCKESIRQINRITGQDQDTGDTDKWTGQKVTLFFDPTIEFPKGKRVGGLRFKEAS
jgi:hypothetical protein